jgi:hypothetical protein
VHRLEDPDDDKVGEGATSSGLEDADSAGAKQTAKFRNCESEAKTPNPSHLQKKSTI